MDRTRVREILRERRIMTKVQRDCDTNGYPYPPELIEYLQAVNRFRSAP